ncbi:hypothetical protein D3C73_1197540 [compost metagenome]
MQEIPSGQRQVRQLRNGFRTVLGLIFSQIKILQQLRPCGLCFSNDDDVAVLRHLLRQQCGMRTAHHNLGSIRLKSLRHPVAMPAVRCIYCDRYQIELLVIRDLLLIFVHKRNFVFCFIYETSQIRHRNLHKIVELLSPEAIDLLILRLDQQYAFSHSPPACS